MLNAWRSAIFTTTPSISDEQESGDAEAAPGPHRPRTSLPPPGERYLDHGIRPPGASSYPPIEARVADHEVRTYYSEAEQRR